MICLPVNLTGRKAMHGIEEDEENEVEKLDKPLKH